MSPKPVVPGALADRDFDNILAYYMRESAPHAVLSFADALENAYSIIGRKPAIGSTRDADELDIPGLRSWALPRFPYVIFYLEQEAHIEVWRILHGRRDIPARLREPEPEPEPERDLAAPGMPAGPPLAPLGAPADPA